MKCKLTAESITSFVGDVVPLRLVADGDITQADIKWSVDSDNVQLRKFSAASYHGTIYNDVDNDRYLDSKYFDRVLLTLLDAGETTVTAELDGEKYACKIVATARKPLPEGKLNYYIGDVHVHTTMEHVHEPFCVRENEHPQDTVDYMNGDGKGLDFSVISDHGCCLDDACFFDGFEVARKNTPEQVIIFAGSESEVTDVVNDRYELRHKNSGEMVVLNSDAYASTNSWGEFYSELAHSPFGVVTLAHPQIIGSPFSGKPGIWHFALDKNNTPEFKNVLRLIETGNGGDRGTNIINEFMYSVALDQGFKVSVTCSSDAHNIPWGIDSMPGKTIIMAPERTREAFLYAMRENRIYASSSGNVKVYYTVNGKTAPCVLDEANKYDFHLELDYFRADETTVPVRLEVISDYGRRVKVIEGEKISTLDFTVESDTARYFYLRLTDIEGRKTWSCPVYTGRATDEPAKSLPCQYVVGKEENLKPIDKKCFTAKDLVTNTDASELISDDNQKEWLSTKTNAEIVIDMLEEKTIRAVGHYPMLMLQSTPENVIKMGGFPAEYEIAVSCDGENYEKCFDGMIRIYGGEVISSFDARKARFVKFTVKNTVGVLSGMKKYEEVPVGINELTVFE